MRKDGKELHKVRDDILEIYADESGKEYLLCPECKRPFEKFLITSNTPESKDGKHSKTKCRDCSIKIDGMGAVAAEVGKLLGDAVKVAI